MATFGAPLMRDVLYLHQISRPWPLVRTYHALISEPKFNNVSTSNNYHLISTCGLSQLTKRENEHIIANTYS